MTAHSAVSGTFEGFYARVWFQFEAGRLIGTELGQRRD